MPLRRALSACGLAESGRPEWFNLAGDPARSRLPHALLGGLCALALALYATRFAAGVRRLHAERTRPGEEAVKLQRELALEKLANDEFARSFDPARAKALGQQIREANFLIALRDHGPIALLNDLEAVKPFSARYSGIRRQVDPGGSIRVSFRLLASGRDAYEWFEKRILRARRFSSLALKGEAWQNGEYAAELMMTWTPGGAPEPTERPRAAAPAAAPASKPAPAPRPAALPDSVPARRPVPRPRPAPPVPAPPKPAPAEGNP